MNKYYAGQYLKIDKLIIKIESVSESNNTYSYCIIGKVKALVV